MTLKTFLISFSKLDIKNKYENLSKIAYLIFERSYSKHQYLSPKFLTEIIWNLAISDFYDKKLFKKIEPNIIKNIYLMNEIDVTQCFYAYCVFNKLAKKNEFKHILDLLVERMQTFKKKFNQRSIKIIRDGINLSNYENKYLNFL